MTGKRSVGLCCVIGCEMCCVSTGGILGRIYMNSFAREPKMVIGIGVGASLGISITCCLAPKLSICCFGTASEPAAEPRMHGGSVVDNIIVNPNIS